MIDLIEKNYILPLTGKWKSKSKIVGDISDPICVVPIFDLIPQLPEIDDESYDSIAVLHTPWQYSTGEIDFDTGTTSVKLIACKEIHEWLNDYLMNTPINQIYKDTGCKKLKYKYKDEK